MSRTFALAKRLAFRTIAAALAIMPAACFDGTEERAVAAYRDHDYATARELARELADSGNPRGFELLALMTAQGLGGDMDLTAAFALIGRAIALDESYRSSQDVIHAFIDKTANAAQAAFEAGEHERARALAGPLAAYGHEAGGELVNRLITGGYVALDGSTMSWRRFWKDCSGNSRRDGTADPAAAFEATCRGRPAVWDGTLVAQRDALLFVKMSPGRRRAHQDLVLELTTPADPTFAARGRKIRFSGTIDERGDASRPDRLVRARVLGPGLLTPEESVREATLERKAIIDSCRRLINRAIRTTHAPDWVDALRERLPRAQRDRLRVYTFIAIDEPLETVARRPDGDWHARMSGSATIQAPNDQLSSVQDFLIDCRLDADHRNRTRGDAFGWVSFEKLSEPRPRL